MANSRFRLTWSSLPAGAARWRWGLFAGFPRPGKRADGVVVCLRGLLLWAGAAAVAAYVAAATALAVWLEQRPYNTVTWVDCLLAPLRRDEIREKRGQAYIQEGLAALDAGRYHDALLKLQAGLARVPDDRRTRQRLASFYLAMNARPRALSLLEGGLDHGYPGRDYMAFLLLVARSGDDHARAEQAIARALAQTEVAAVRDRPWLEEQRAQGLLDAGRPADALAWVEGLAAPSDLAREVRVLALIELGRAADAEAALQQWRSEAGATEQVLRLGVRVARENGDLVRMRERLEELRRLAPAQPHAYAFGIVQELLAGETERAAALLDHYLLRFGATAARLRLVAEPLAQVGNRPLLERVLTAAREQNLLDWGLRVTDVQLALKEGDWARARAALSAIQADVRGEPPPEQAAWLALTQRAVAAAESPLAGLQIDLIGYANRLNLSLEVLVHLVDLLERAGRDATALQLAQVGLRRYPSSRYLEARRAALADRVTEQLPLVALEEPVATGEPTASVTIPGGDAGAEESLAEPDPVLTPAARISPAGFTATWNRLQAEGRLTDLRRLVHEIRRDRPDWLAGYEDTLHEREVELLLQLHDLPALVAAVRLRLDGSTPRGLEAMRLVTRLDASGRRDVAELILAEVLQRQPEFPPAVRQRRAWQAATEGAKQVQ